MNKEALEDISKSLFTASEALRVALDISDLKDVPLGYWKSYIEATMRLLEAHARDLQKEARS